MIILVVPLRLSPKGMRYLTARLSPRYLKHPSAANMVEMYSRGSCQRLLEERPVPGAEAAKAYRAIAPRSTTRLS